MNIDKIVDWLILPLLKCPFVVTLPFYRTAPQATIIAITWTIILRYFMTLNQHDKCRGDKPWLPLREIPRLTVLVTGGSSGLGQSIITRLLKLCQDITIVNIDLNKPDRKWLDDTRVQYYQCNLVNVDQLESTIKQIKKDHATVHVIINNAAVRSTYSRFIDSDMDKAAQVMQINALAPARIVQEFLPRDDDDTTQCYVVNVASALGILAPANIATYAASKAALIAFHKSLAYELESRNVSNVRTLLCTPGQLNTSMFSGFTPPRQFLAPILDTDKLSGKIIECCEQGQRGDLCLPLYATFCYLLMSMPFTIQKYMRRYSQMDECLPAEQH